MEWNDNKLVIDIEIFVCSKFHYHWKFDAICNFFGATKKMQEELLLSCDAIMSYFKHHLSYLINKI